MSYSVNPLDAIDALKDCYRSLDLRIAAVKEGDKWNNVVTVVRLSYEEPDVRKEKLLHRIYRLPLRTNNFLIIGEVQPFSTWPDFLSRYREGQLPYDHDRRERIIINWPQVADLNGFNTSISTGSNLIRNLDGTDWPRIQVGVGQFHPQKLQRKELQIDSARFSAPDPHTIIANTLGISLGSSRPISNDFLLDAMVPIDITPPKILGTRDKLEFGAAIHKGLAAVEVLAEFTRLDVNYNADSISRLELQHTVVATRGQIEERKYSAAFGSDDSGPWLYIRAIHPKLPPIVERSYRTQELLPREALNPLMAILRRFCKPDDPRTLVLNPEVQERHRTKPSALFELRASWLLSALGFQLIILGKYEKLVAPATNHEYGSVDIIAAHPNSRSLFLIGCSLDPPKEIDKDRLINVAAVLKREVFEDFEQHFRPVIITGASQCGTESSTPGVGNPRVLVIDREGIERIWDAAEAGNSEQVVRWMET